MPTPDAQAPDVALPRPTNARYIVLAFLCSMAFVLYLDRVCISQALKPMKDEFDLTNTQTSLVLMAFTLAYGIFEIPTGRWGDRFGSRRVLTRIVLWWSAFTALTGCVWTFRYEIDFLPIPLTITSLWLLVTVRFLFGAGEAGAIPNAARIMLLWFPHTERGRIQGLYQASMHIGGTVAPTVAAAIIDLASWRMTFILFGIVGVVWAIGFFWWFRDTPAEHPAVNEAEVQLIGAPANTDAHAHGPMPWSDVLTHPNVWLLSIIIILSAFNSYLFFSWYSTYLQEARNVTNQTAGWLAGLALLGATAGSLCGGWLSDRITRHAADCYRARRRVCLIGFVTAALSIVVSVQIDSAWLSALLCAIACLAMFCQLPIWWACAFDISGKHPGALFGLLNGSGVVGAMGSQYFFGAFADWRKALGHEGRDQWDPAFYLCVGTLLAAGILWQFIVPRRVIGEPQSPPDEPTPPPVAVPSTAILRKDRD